MDEEKDRRTASTVDPLYGDDRNATQGGYRQDGYGAPPQGAPYYGQQPPQGYPQNQGVQKQKANVCGILSLIFGIASAIFMWVPVMVWVGIVLAIAAIPLGAVGKKGHRKGYGMGIAGMTLGIVVVALFVILIILAVTVLSGLMNFVFQQA